MSGVSVRKNGDMHNFVLVLSGATEPDGELEDALFEAGCDDATLVFRNHVPYLEFDRRAPRLDVAIRSAVRDVQRAGLPLPVVSIEAGHSS
ncbi:MAG: hypothetical protein ACRD21_18040 [Vicinamibacteria bacterium]